MGTFRFAVMGDMHYLQPESHKNVFGGQPGTERELKGLQNRYWTTQHILPLVISAIRELKPDFVIQTGDIIHGHCDSAEDGIREMSEALEMLEGLQAPVYFALGNHDGTPGKPGDEPVKQVLYPALGQALGRSDIASGYYTFEKEESLFVVLEYPGFQKNGEQAAFLRNALAHSGEYKHVFMFAHPPLIPIARPFFTDFDFVNTILGEVARYPIDAYFCGHTHNQIASLHKVGDRWLPQLKSTVLGKPEVVPVNISDVWPLLCDLSSAELGWGFIENTAPGWWMVTVDGEDVQADWHVLHKAVCGQISWRTGEKAVFKEIPDLPSTLAPLPQLHDIRSVRIKAAGSNCKAAKGYRAFLNGELVGHFPPLEHYGAQYIEVDPRHWPLLKSVNRIDVMTADEVMCIGAFLLEVKTESVLVRSQVSDYFANSDRWDHWNMNHLQKIRIGETISIDLLFQ
ncbi:metallophosphoesterase [Paenibacillus filicis]|uniref:Metallophosphoesterase n=1 Tax=Paenibacillus gyeongsangnamensis TaxID=3388067 RepID=A0ABT4Q451_9BACL|nr:metallophosphoesterase [Paenibacillus filicis]MCZ8511654.1 metallophosphoesterase [Paenibacillus filicis]